MSFLNVFSLLTGLAFFLYGVTLMGDGLNLVAGNRLEAVLFRLTSSRARLRERRHEPRPADRAA